MESIVFSCQITCAVLCWFLLRLSVHDPVLPLNVESDVPGGVKLMLKSLYEVLKNANGIDLTNLKEEIGE